MKCNKKGFTLIELLAVIVILAIIALIATPIVLNIIAKARKSAAQDSLYGVISAAKTTYMSSLLDEHQVEIPAVVKCTTAEGCIFYDKTGTDKQSYTTTDGNTVEFIVSFSGTVPSEGQFSIDRDGKVEATTAPIQVNGFSCNILENEKVTCS